MRYFTFPKIQNQSINKLFSLLNIKKTEILFLFAGTESRWKNKKIEKGVST